MQDLMSRLAGIRDANSGVIDADAAAREGISKADLSQLCGEGKLVRVGRGRFVIPKDSGDEMVALAHDKNLVFSHQSALYLHGLLDSPGDRHAVTLLDGTEPDPKVAAKCDVHFVPQTVYDMGRTLVATQLGNLVPAYDLERAVCDVALARDQVGLDTFLTAITRYSQDSRCDETKLYEYGAALNVDSILHQYLDVLRWAQSDDL